MDGSHRDLDVAIHVPPRAVHHDHRPVFQISDPLICFFAFAQDKDAHGFTGKDGRAHQTYVGRFSVETFAVDRLTRGQTYYFAVRALDGGGAAGGVSNIVSGVPANGADHTPPATVQELTARLSNASVKVTATVDSASSELSPQRAAASVIDGDVSTAWMTTAASLTTPAWVILDLGSVQPLVKFRTNPSTLDLVGSYPQDFEIQTSVDKVNWVPMVHVQGLIGTFGRWNEWSAPVTYARYARVYITKRGPAPTLRSRCCGRRSSARIT